MSITDAIIKRLRLTTTDPVFRPAIVKKVGPIEKQTEVPIAANSPKNGIIHPVLINFAEYISHIDLKQLNGQKNETSLEIYRNIL